MGNKQSREYESKMIITDYKSIVKELKLLGIEAKGLDQESVNTALLILILKQLHILNKTNPLQ